jgi:hypothetical protein
LSEDKEEGEFFYNGEMYDVIDLQINNGQVSVKCVSDKKETSLVELYNKLANPGSKKASVLIQLLNNPFIQPGKFELLPLVQQRVPYHSICRQFLPSSSPEVLTPPPQV